MVCQTGPLQVVPSKEEGKDWELIQSSTTPDDRHHMGVTKHKQTSHTREPRGQPFPSRRSKGCKKQIRQHNKSTLEA